MTDPMLYQDFFDALIKGDRKKSNEILSKKLEENTSIEDIYEKVIKNAMYKIGDLWETGEVSVATEHMASAIVESELNRIFDSVNTSNKDKYKTAVLACVEKEYHQIGIKMVSDILEDRGWNTYFLGSNVPPKELNDFIGSVRPDLIALSFSIYFNLNSLEEMIKKIKESFPDQLIIVGGQAFLHGGHEVLEKYNNVKYFKDLYELETFIETLK